LRPLLELLRRVLGLGEQEAPEEEKIVPGGRGVPEFSGAAVREVRAPDGGTEVVSWPGGSSEGGPSAGGLGEVASSGREAVEFSGEVPSARREAADFLGEVPSGRWEVSGFAGEEPGAARVPSGASGDGDFVRKVRPGSSEEVPEGFSGDMVPGWGDTHWRVETVGLSGPPTDLGRELSEVLRFRRRMGSTVREFGEEVL